MRDLGTLGGPDAFGIVINDREQVLGFSLTATGNGDAFLWENGRMQDIPDALGGTQINPFYLNNQGMAIGNASVTGDQAFHPFLITGEQHTLLGTMTTSATNGTVLEPWLDSMINDKSDFVPVLAP